MEIKKAFNKFKKDLRKETGISGGFTLSQQQLYSRTATLRVFNIIPYDAVVQKLKDDREFMMNKDHHDILIAEFLDLKIKYGTKENQLNETLVMIKNSEAFKKFQSEIGSTVTLTTETNNNFYYIRFHY